MREHKYRAWYPAHNKMYYNLMVGELAPGAGTVPVILNEDGERVNLWGDNSEGTIMDYIGHQDINGVDIYESDLVRINHPLDRTGDFTGAIGEVFWWDENDAWYHTNNHGRPPKRMWDYVEVIGNLYETPDLAPKE